MPPRLKHSVDDPRQLVRRCGDRLGHPEGNAAMRRKNAPNVLGDRCRFFAASRNVCAVQFAACARRGRFHHAPRFLRVGDQVQPTARVLLTRDLKG